jgi:type I restriction enzyme S subunit
MKTKLPEGWKEVELGNQEYFTILSSGINEFEGEKDYLSTESIQGTKIEKIECVITYADRPSRANMQPVLNSVWFAKMQATLKVYSFDEENKKEIKKYILSTGFAGIKVNEKLVSPKYLRLMLISNDFNELKDKLSTGSTQRGINNHAIETISLIIPPLPIQQKIVSCLEKAEKAKELRKEADELTKDFLKSVFMEMFGDPVFNKKKFPVEKLNTICDVRDGTHDSPDYVSEGYPLITSKNLTNGFIDFSEINLISKEDFDLVNKRSKVDAGDIIMPMIGTIGNPVIIPKNIREFAIKNVALIKFTKTNVSNIYIKFLLDSHYFDQITSGNNRGGTQKFIALGDIRNIPIPLPPISLQNKFASIVKEVEQLKEQQKHSKEHLDNLFNVLMQKAFKGELTI